METEKKPSESSPSRASKEVKPNGSREEIGSQLFRMFGHRHDPIKLEERIKQLKEIYTQPPKQTIESYGLINYRDQGNLKVEGKLSSKSDFRLDEVSLSGERALPTSYEVPPHPLTKQPIEELDIVKEGFISIEDVQEILDFVKGDDFGRSVLNIALTCPGLEDREITSQEKARLRDTIQLLVGIHVDISYKKDEMSIQKYKINTHQRSPLLWLWPQPYVRFVVADLHCTSDFNTAVKRADSRMRPKFTWTHVENRTTHSHIFVQVSKLEPELIDWCFCKRASNYSFTENEISIGNYKGNIFRFALRDFKTSEEDLTTIFKDFEENGYINYFNMNTPYSNMLEPGKLFTLSMWKEGIESMLRPYSQPIKSELEESKALYFIFQDAKPLVEPRTERISHPIQKIFQLLTRERELNKDTTSNILQSSSAMEFLAEIAETFLNFIWNQTVNKLIEKRGLKLAVGDLVFANEEEEHRVLYQRKFGACIPKVNISEEKENKSIELSVKALTQEDIDSGTYTIFDMVIPVCGSDVTWPQNDVGDFIGEVLEENGISKGKEHFKDLFIETNPFSINGTYHKVLCKPESLKWWTKEYKTASAPLIMDDLPVVQSKKVTKQKEDENLKVDKEADDNVKNEENENKVESNEAEKGVKVKKGLVIEFFVPKTTHLSAPLRELFKKNDLGSTLFPFSDIRQIKQERIEKLLNGFDNYMKNLPRIKAERERKNVPRDDHKKNEEDAAQRIDRLERELAILRKERELEKMRKQMDDDRGTRRRRSRDVSPRRRSRSRDRSRRSPNRRSNDRYSRRRDNSRDRHSRRRDDSRDRHSRRRDDSRDRYPRRRNNSRDRTHYSPKPRDRYSPPHRVSSNDTNGRFNVGQVRDRTNFDTRGPVNFDPRDNFSADSLRNFNPNLRGLDQRGPFNADIRDRFNVDPRFGQGPFNSGLPQGNGNGRDDQHGIKRMRLDLNQSADDNLYNPFEGGARNMNDVRGVWQ